MTTKNTGGPAFHTPVSKPLENYYTGMTLRDYFAAQAMPQILATAYPRDWTFDGYENWDGMVANIAYSVADAMLAERDRSE